MNSSKKNKIAKFNQDKATPSATPRRDTYTLDTPTVGFSLQTSNDDLAVSSASPQLKKTPRNEELNVTLTRGSEKKSLKKRKVSFVTPIRRSARLSSATPHYSSVKDRPKTPIPTRVSSGAKRGSLSVRGKKILVGTSEDLSEADEQSVEPDETGAKSPVASQSAKSDTKRTPVKNSGTKRAISPSPAPHSKVKNSPRSGTKRSITPSSSAPPSKVKITPNFNKLHKKEFNKMESIDEYQKRKETNSAKKVKEQLKFHVPAKSKLPKKVAAKKTRSFGGIPFIPSVMSTKFMKTNFAPVGSKPNFTAGKKPATKKASPKVNAPKMAQRNARKLPKSTSAENTPLRKRRTNFDLQASLSKKLPYKPHKGPLKPLPINMNSSTFLSSTPAVGTKNAVVKAKRAESREVLHGVRKNKRFALQMSNRKIV